MAAAGPGAPAVATVAAAAAVQGAEPGCYGSEFAVADPNHPTQPGLLIFLSNLSSHQKIKCCIAF